MANTSRRRLSVKRSRSPFLRAQQPEQRRKFSFQYWLFNLTLIVMGILVAGFIISAITTRSGIEIAASDDTITDQPRLLTVPSGTIVDEEQNADYTSNRIEVEVLNGCGVPGMANEFADYLRRNGYDVIRFTNAQRYDYPRTLVVSRGTDFDLARLVAQTLGVEPNAVENMPDPSLQLDVTVVLGQDYNTLTSYREIVSSRQ